MGGVKRVERLWDLVKYGSVLRVSCANPNCGRVSDFNPAALRDFLQASPFIDQMKFRCELCGSTKFHWEAVQLGRREIALAPPAPIAVHRRMREREPTRPAPAGPPLTLAGLQRNTTWVHWYCDARLPGGGLCGFHTPLAVAPYAILWGLRAPATMLRTNLGCPRCHALGGTVKHPSWGDMTIGWEPFPAHEMSLQPTILAVGATIRADDL